jgi:hypothetical protein
VYIRNSYRVFVDLNVFFKASWRLACLIKKISRNDFGGMFYFENSGFNCFFYSYSMAVQ